MLLHKKRLVLGQLRMTKQLDTTFKNPRIQLRPVVAMPVCIWYLTYCHGPSL